jgi:glycosyltransferase involved in cell wall biosynthesis
MTYKEKDLSLVIACYNEAPVLEESVCQVIKVLDSTCWSSEIIFVDDCSKDNTRDIIQKLVQKYSDHDMQVLLHEKNTGRGRTVSDGFRAAKGRVVGFIDIDLETPAHYIPPMVMAIHDGADVATAYRIYKLHFKLLHRFILSQGYIRLMHFILGLPLHDTETGYKFFRRDKLLPILDQTQDAGWFWDTEIMTRAYLAGYRIDEIPTLFIKRYDKKSSVHLVHDSLDYFFKLWKFRKIVKKIAASVEPIIEHL